MLRFKEYSLDVLREIQPLLVRSPFLCSDLSAGTFLMWHEGVDMRFAVYHDTLIVRENIGDEPAFSYPIGTDPNEALDALFAYVLDNDLPFKLYGLDADRLAATRTDPRFAGALSGFERKWSDYIYNADDMAAFQGKRFSGQRNHINKFRRFYGEPDLRPITEADIPALQAMLDEYKGDHADQGLEERAELRHTRELLTAFRSLGMIGAWLCHGGRPIAFSIGEVIGEQLIIHVEKALRNFEGAYPVMFNSFVKYAKAVSNRPFRWVNREDDAGDLGLRTSKLQYHPAFLLDKYVLRIGSPLARLVGPITLEGDGVWLTDIAEADKDAYFALSIDRENNRWWGYDYTKDDSLTGPVDADTFFEMQRYDRAVGDCLSLAVRLSPDGPLLGEAVLYHFTLKGGAEIGCRILPEYQDKRLGKRAFARAARFAAELGAKPNARCYRENTVSRKMIEAAGFVMTREDAAFCYFAPSAKLE